MTLDRRSFLKTIGTTAALTAVGTTALAREQAEAPADAVGMLYDSTLCVGCRACMSACRTANGLEPLKEEGGIYDAPIDANSHTKTIIRLMDDNGSNAWIKDQCMHCVDPGCVSVCMIGSLKKDDYGIVTYDKDRCIGCRYCQLACPFNVPKFEWDSATPLIVKCEMCNHLLDDGKQPACCDICPREAIIFGDYSDLLAEANRRIETEPDRYNPELFGDKEGGGTQVLYLAPKNISHQDLGLPDLDDQSIPELSETIQHGIYKGFVAPVALYAALGAVMIRNRRHGGER